MPPKKKENVPSKKTEQKKKEKVIEDKTFGLKNKKGTKQQKYIGQVEKQVKFGNQKASKVSMQSEAERAKKKDDKIKELDELNALFRPVAQSVKRGVDPKSVLCAFFKQGQCGKGDKCKFSHDANVNRKVEKKSMYDDMREEDSMENWDEAKLEEVINKKHGKESATKTTIICKFFLEALEISKYGWFWTCPNGGDKCMYKHALPPGFVLKRDQKKEDKVEEITIEELIEKERASLGHNTTKVTLESFLKWKARKKREKVEQFEADQDKKKIDYKQGKMFGISGRQMFEFNPDLVLDDDDEAGEGYYTREPEEDEAQDDGRLVDLNLDNVTAMAKETDGTGTQMTEEQQNSRLQQIHDDAKKAEETEENAKLDMAGALPELNGAGDSEQCQTDDAFTAATVNGEIADVPIDEDLFAGDDMDALDEDLDTLDLSV